MDTKDFRRHAHAFVDWMADYLAEVERYPVRAQVKPGEVAAKLPLTPPERGEPMETIFADFTSVVLPGITHWQHPSFFAYFPANSSPPSVLAEMLTATLGAQCMLWQTSPAATELETRVLDWLRQMTGLPEGFTGVIQDSASSAILCALLTARERGGRRRRRATPRLLLDGDPLGDGEGRQDRGARPRQRPQDPGRRPVRDATGRARGRDPRGPGGRCHPGLCRGLPRDDGRRRAGSAAPDRRGVPAPQRLAPRGRGVGGERADPPRAPRDARRHRARGQLRVQPSQVALHQLRLLRALRARPGRSRADTRDPARLPQDARARPRHRLPRLECPARAPLPRAEALVRDPRLRGGRAPADGRRAHRARARGRRVDPGGARLRADGAAEPRARELSLPPARRGGSEPARPAERAVARGAERQR